MSSGRQPTNRRVLVIDEDAATHDDFRRILAQAPARTSQVRAEPALPGVAGGAPDLPAGPSYELDVALQGPRGLEMVQRAVREKKPYALAFVDMRTPPGCDGLDTAGRLMSADEDLQIVICAACSDRGLEEISRRLGPTDRVLVLKKPFGPVEVLQLAHAMTHKWFLGQEVRRRVEELERRIRQQAAVSEYHSLHDRLTGLPNRALLTERIRVAIEHHRRSPERAFAVLVVDLDRFKILNDSLGHEVGDRYLVEIARRLKECLRGADEVCRGTPVRMGGDEFIIFLDELARVDDVTVVAERILKVLSQPVELDGRRIEGGASIGIATSERAYDNPADVIRDADIAMYQAKAAGRGRCMLFHQAMHEKVVSRSAMESELRQAVEQGQFILHYQPIVHVEGGIESLEALVRWEHPTRGLLGPGAFVPLAEEIGLIADIDRLVLREACRQLGRWRRRFGWCRELCVSVNVSRRHVHDPRLIEAVLSALTESQIPPECLALEITESAVLEDKQAALEALRRLHEAGVHLHLDDFGTGQSSLSCLHELPLSALKIDRAFVDAIERRPELPAILRSIVEVAEALKIQVIVEGVERLEQIDILRRVGCRKFQGYLLARPLDVRAMEQILQAGQDAFACHFDSATRAMER